MKPLVAASVLAMIACAAAARAQTVTGDARLISGRDAVERGDSVRAHAMLDELADASEARTRGQALFMLGDLAEHELRFADALARYGASATADPGGRYAARAMARVEYLHAHSEGSFAPLAALDAVRRDPHRSSDVAAVRALADQLRAFPPGRVRAESRLLVGQAYAGRLDRPREAAAPLVDLADDPAAPPEMRLLAIELLARVREQTGDLDEGVSDLVRLHAPTALVAHLRELVRRRLLLHLSVPWLAVVLAAGAISFVRVLRARRLRTLLRAWSRPLPIAHLAMLSLGGAFLAQSHDQHSITPFLAFGAGALAVYLVASAWSVVGSERLAARVLRSTTCAVGMLAVSFLAMYRFDQDMLIGIGL